MMSSSPPSASTPATSFPTTPSAPPTHKLVTPITSPSISPETIPPTPTPPEMTLASDLVEQNMPQLTPNDVGQGIAPILPFTTQLPASTSELLAEMICLDPALQSIDPALIMMGVAQGHHRPATVGPVVNIDPSPPPHPSHIPEETKPGSV